MTASLPIARIGAEKQLAVAVQQKLTEHGYLDPPPDGDFRSVSLWAIAEFCKRNDLPSDVFGPEAPPGHCWCRARRWRSRASRATGSTASSTT